MPNEYELNIDFDEVDETGMSCAFPYTPNVLTSIPIAPTARTLCRPLGKVTPPKPCVRHGPCDGPVAQGCSCPNGDVCAPIFTGDRLCLAPCNTDADCPNSAMTCNAGSCVLSFLF